VSSSKVRRPRDVDEDVGVENIGTPSGPRESGIPVPIKRPKENKITSKHSAPVVNMEVGLDHWNISPKEESPPLIKLVSLIALLLKGAKKESISHSSDDIECGLPGDPGDRELRGDPGGDGDNEVDGDCDADGDCAGAGECVGECVGEYAGEFCDK